MALKRNVRWLALALGLMACSAQEAQRPEVRSTPSKPPPVAPPVSVAALAGAALPAGACALDAYVSGDEACEGVPAPRFAVLLAAAANAPAAEEALARGLGLGLPVGYPFVLASDEIPWQRAQKGLFAVVAGLFVERARAEALRDALAGAQLVELVPEEALQALWVWDGTRGAVVEIVEPTPAYAEADVERMEQALDELLAAKWVALPAQKTRRADALAKLAPRCTVAKGHLFMTTQGAIVRRQYAPVRCADGSSAWVPWRATRLQSVVTRGDGGAVLHQVVLVECDVPTIERRRFGALSTEPPLRIALGGGC